jgi:tetratricopeptide (TPR) repeat protein
MTQNAVFDVAGRGRTGRVGLAALTALATLLGACSRGKGGDAAGSASAPLAPSAALSAGVAASASARAAAPAASASAAQTLAERQTLLLYQHALERGRAATVRGELAEAERAFDEALSARPHDARALAERGYARLRAERLDEADADLAAAQGHVADNTLSAQVYYNRGLIAEKRGQAVLARDYFAFSLDANPTAAARRKLAGKSTCPASVSVPDADTPPLEVFPSLAAARRELELSVEDSVRESESPVTNEAVRELLGLKDCSLGCGAGSSYTDWNLLWEMPDGRVAALRQFDQGAFYRCGGPPGIVGNPAGPYLWVTSENVEFVTSLCGPCDENYCPSCCVDGPWHRIDLFIDKGSLRVLLRVEQRAEESERRKEAELTLKEGVVQLHGKGCDWTIPLGGAPSDAASGAPAPSTSTAGPAASAR